MPRKIGLRVGAVVLSQRSPRKPMAPTHQIECVVSGKQTRGAAAYFREITAPGMGPPKHTHRQQEEIFHVIRGQHRFYLEGKTTDLGPGGCILIPRGAVHTWKNIDEAPGELHYGVLPANDTEAFFDRLTRGDFDRENLGEFFADFGMDLMGPPLE